ncbi:unnamed protein product [Camellia sinensis]
MYPSVFLYNIFLYNKPLVIGDNGESSEGLFTGTHAPNRGFNTGDRPTTVSECHDNDIECALDCVPELDLSVTSSQWQIDASASNICTALELRKSAKATPKSRFADENDVGASSSAIKISRIASQQLDCDNELLELTKFSGIIRDNHAVRQAKVECLSKEKDANIYCGRITRSRSSCNLSSRDSKPLKLLSSSDIAKEDGARKTTSQSTCIEGVSKPVHSSDIASQRVARSKSGASKKSLLVNSLNMLEGLVIQNVSGKADYVTEPDRILDGPVDARAACCESNLDAAGLSVGLEIVLSRPPSDCSMSMKRKTLDLDDGEKCSLNETFNPIMEKERLDKSSGKRCTVVKSATSLDKVTFDDPCRESLEMQSLEQEVSNKREEPRRVSFETCVEECVVVDEEVSELDINKNLQNAEDNSDAVVEIQRFPFSHKADVALLNVDKGPGVEMHQKVTCHIAKGFESSPRLQVEEGEIGCDGRDTNKTTPFAFKHQQIGSLVSNLTKHSVGVQGCLVGEVGMTDPSSAVLDVRQCYEEDNQDLMCIENKLDEGNMSGGLACSARTLLERKSHVGEDGLLACGSVGSLHSEEKNFSSSEIRELQLLESSLQLGRRLRSVSEDSWPQFKRRKIDGQQTNFFSASPSFRVKEIHGMGGHTTNKIVKSMEDNLETVLQIEFLPVSHEGDAAQLNADKSPDMELNQKVNYHLSEGIEPSPELQLEQAAGDSHGCFMENVGPADTTSIVLDLRLWDRISSNSSSSGKQRSLNPELTCFPIEEDPSISGENENIDEVADTIQEDISSTLMTRAKRQPLAEIKEACVNPPTSVSAAERFLDRNSLDSTNTEVSATGAQSRIKQKLGNCYSNKRRCTNEAKENRSLSISTNCIKKATESLNNRFSKPKLSGKTSLRKSGQNLLERESKRNNIVSNITFFLPLVQQKQAAAVGTGKRDIKVKALEAAEAAKRLEEKRQNERKMKKDALKLKRERKKQESLRQMEINKKKKEEEQKKKDADMAARKRLREEGEGKKKKARKEKEVPFGAMDENVNDGKESNNELRKHQKMKKPQTDPTRAAEISTSNASQVILEDCQAFSHFGDNGESRQ